VREGPWLVPLFNILKVRYNMAITITTKSSPKNMGHLVTLDPEINQAIEFIMDKKKCTKDEFIKESIYRNINYFMQVETVGEPKVEEKKTPTRKRRSTKK
jgi:hypothetical protein